MLFVILLRNIYKIIKVYNNQSISWLRIKNLLAVNFSGEIIISEKEEKREEEIFMKYIKELEKLIKEQVDQDTNRFWESCQKSIGYFLRLF